ncbi:Chromatin assembly factor 1 subunit A [Sarcoptes scabiei]|nr:Chromatin assembly factor 1 subunit A [Sarcoptes scabiei]
MHRHQKPEEQQHCDYLVRNRFIQSLPLFLQKESDRNCSKCDSQRQQSVAMLSPSFLSSSSSRKIESTILNHDVTSKPSSYDSFMKNFLEIDHCQSLNPSHSTKTITKVSDLKEINRDSIQLSLLPFSISSTSSSSSVSSIASISSMFAPSIGDQFLIKSSFQMHPSPMDLILRCSLPHCHCECFVPDKLLLRMCAHCNHGWIAHANDDNDDETQTM